MFTSQSGLSWKISPLYWEILKAKAFTCLEKLLFGRKRNVRKSEPTRFNRDEQPVYRLAFFLACRFH